MVCTRPPLSNAGPCCFFSFVAAVPYGILRLLPTHLQRVQKRGNSVIMLSLALSCTSRAPECPALSLSRGECGCLAFRSCRVSTCRAVSLLPVINNSRLARRHFRAFTPNRPSPPLDALSLFATRAEAPHNSNVPYHSVSGRRRYLPSLCSAQSNTAVVSCLLRRLIPRNQNSSTFPART